jgi:type IV secretory pathway VirB4 component
MKLPFKFFKGKIYTDEYTLESTIDETNPRFYDTNDFVFFDVTEVMPDPDSNRPYKFMLFRHIEEGNTVQGQRIGPEHPMYNFPDII